LWGFKTYTSLVPRGLYRCHHARTAHFITFTCYHRYPHLADARIRDLFVQALERTRSLYRMKVYRCGIGERKDPPKQKKLAWGTAIHPKI
jgi:hypothetical protein